MSWQVCTFGANFWTHRTVFISVMERSPLSFTGKHKSVSNILILAETGASLKNATVPLDTTDPFVGPVTMATSSSENHVDAAGALNGDNSRITLRKSGSGMIGKAKLNTIKITLTLVGVFLACWTPYYVICLWWATDVHSVCTRTTGHAVQGGHKDWINLPK